MFKIKILSMSVLKVLLGALALFASSQVSIPIKPVPVNLQTFIVMLIGLTYSPKDALSTIISFLGLGALGVPVFSNFNFGIIYMTGPAGGYLLGFLLAAGIMSYLKDKYNNTFINNILLCVLGHIVIYSFGISWLSNFVGLKNAIYHGFIVFIPSGVIKIFLLCYTLKYVKKFQTNI